MNKLNIKAFFKNVITLVFMITISILPLRALPNPHGGQLIDRFVPQVKFDELLAKSKTSLEINKKNYDDIECIASGIYSPLVGFMNKEDYHHVITEMRLKNGLLWSVPVTLDVSTKFTKNIKEGDLISLIYNDQVVAILKIGDIYTYDKKAEEKHVFNTTASDHPGVNVVEAQKDYYVGGEIFVLNGIFDHNPFAQDKLYPKQARNEFQRRGWKTVVAFQTRNPLHRAHEYIQKSALETVDGLFLNPLVGQTKGDDVPADVRMKTYKVMLQNYYNPEKVILSIFPAAMRYAGPKEAIMHAIARQNYGCTHMIVGRDHAGVKDFYGPYDAQEIFDTLKENDLEVQPLKFENAFYCAKTKGMATLKTCPADSEQLQLSGTKVREMLSRGERLPAEITRPEVAEILAEHYSNQRAEK